MQKCLILENLLSNIEEKSIALEVISGWDHNITFFIFSASRLEINFVLLTLFAWIAHLVYFTGSQVSLYLSFQLMMVWASS